MDTQTRVTRPRSSRRGLVLTALGGLLLLAGLGGFIRGPGAAAPAAGPQRMVLVASRTLAAGAQVGPGDVSEQPVADDLASRDGLGRPSDAVGRHLLVSIPAGSLVSRFMLGPAPVEQLHRVVTMTLSRHQLDAGIRPGDQVDVIAALAEAGGRAQRVLAVGVATVLTVGDVPAGVAPLRAPAGAQRADDLCAVALDADGTNAMRLIWVDDFAREVRLLRRGDGAPAPTAADVTSLP